MRGTAVKTLVALLLLSTASAVPLSFESPGSFRASHGKVEGGQWLVAVFKPPAEAGTLEVPAAVQHVNVSTVHEGRLRGPQKEEVDVVVHDEVTESETPPTFIRYSPSNPELASIYVEAEHLTVEARSIAGDLEVKEASLTTLAFARTEDREYRVRDHYPGGNHAVVTMMPQPGSSAVFTALGAQARYAEWYNLEPSCSTKDCPANGGSSVQSTPLPNGWTLSKERHSYEILSGEMGGLSIQGELVYLAIGGERLDAFASGSLRLPLASVDCSSCAAPDGQTLAASGNITLSGLHMGADGNLGGDISGEFGSLRFDESSIDPAALTGKVALVTAAAVGGLVAVVKFLLWPLFTRHKGDALDHPSRRALFEQVRANPGISFRALLRATGIPRGSARHHLDRLVALGRVVERRNGALHYFEGGEAPGDWRDRVLLRDANLGRLHEWLRRHPRAPQKDVIAAMAGWRPSTTQHRLDRLIRAGLVEVAWEGRVKRHTAR